MADIGQCFSYLCGWCCCFKAPERDAEENQLRNTSRRHPKEQQVDDDFMARNYVQDKSGHFQRTANSNQQLQPTLPPLPELRPLEPFNDMVKSPESGSALAVNGGAGSSPNPEEGRGPGAAKLVS